MIRNLWVPQNAGNLTSWELVNFSTTLLDRVRKEGRKEVNK
jgi:hypothetical protein